MTESEAWFALNLAPDVGAATVRAGIALFGSAAAFFGAGATRLADVSGIGPRRAERLDAAFRAVDWKGELARARASSLSVVTPADPDYPPLLARIDLFPLALYVAGDPAVLRQAAVAMVGTRAPTNYGRENARSFAYRLAQAGLCIVSGLARGIDTESAEGALLAGGKTVAVIGSALDRLYPPENRELARRIVRAGGAVVSEYPFGRQADRQTFPMRNRIISGLSLGVLCVEAGVASGTLITADHALEQGRPVMAIPGRVTDPTAQGCHKLVKAGARLVETPADVLDELSRLPLPDGAAAPAPAAAEEPRPSPAPLRADIAAAAASPEENAILFALADGEKTPDAIVAAAGLPAHKIAPLLIGLEMKGFVRRLPGNHYKRA